MGEPSSGDLRGVALERVSKRDIARSHRGAFWLLSCERVEGLMSVHLPQIDSGAKRDV